MPDKPRVIELTLTIWPTTELVTLGGKECRRWRGRTAGGLPCNVYVALVAVASQLDTRELDDTLRFQGTGPLPTPGAG